MDPTLQDWRHRTANFVTCSARMVAVIQLLFKRQSLLITCPGPNDSCDATPIYITVFTFQMAGQFPLNLTRLVVVHHGKPRRIMRKHPWYSVQNLNAANFLTQQVQRQYSPEIALTTANLTLFRAQSQCGQAQSSPAQRILRRTTIQHESNDGLLHLATYM